MFDVFHRNSVYSPSLALRASTNDYVAKRATTLP